MATDPALIAIDREVLLRSARTLHDTAQGLAAVSQAIADAPIGSTAFGLMNQWMVSPIQSLAQNSTEQTRVCGNVVDVLGHATEDAANDFEATEGDVLVWVKELDEHLAAGAAPLAPPAPAPVPNPTPMPTPSPSPQPAPQP